MGNAGIYGQRRNKTITETKEPTKKTKKVPINPLDLNRDGKVDKKDASIAGKVMAHRRRKLR